MDTDYFQIDVAFNRVTGTVVRNSKQSLKPDTGIPDLPEEWLINPDLTPVIGVPEKYWKINVEGTGLASMDVNEKAVVDAAELAAMKSSRYQQIWSKTKKLIGNHFEYESKSYAFPDVIEILTLQALVAAEPAPDPFPLICIQAADGTFLELTTQLEVQAYWGVMMSSLIQHKTDESTLIHDVRIAVDVLEVNAVVDNR